MAAQDYYSVVQELYIAYFGRPADHYGLLNYAAQLDALKAPTDYASLTAAVLADTKIATPLGKLVNSFSTSAESTALYGSVNVTNDVSIANFVLSIYHNLLGREPDTDGFNFWVGAIKSGSLSLAYAATSITAGALKDQSAQGLKDAQTVTNKLAVATSFTNSLVTPTQWTAFAGDAAAAAARNLIAGVNNTTVPTAYQTNVDALVTQLTTGQSVGTTFTLTKGVDSGATFTGGASNDIFNAVIDNDGTTNNTTLTPLDAINGGSGVDTLNLNVLQSGSVGGALGALPAVTATSIETVNVRSAVGLTADFSTWNDVTNVNVIQGAAVTLTASNTAAINISGTTGAVVAQGGSSQSISVSGAAVTSGSTTTSSLNTKGDVAITLAKAAANNVQVNGGNNVTVTTTGETTGTINIGSNFQATGAVNVNVTGAAYDATSSNASLGSITVKGGTSVVVNQTAYADTAAAAADTSASILTQGAVGVDAFGTATSVTVNQSKAVTFANARTAITGVNQSAAYTVGALLKNQTLTVAGLTFTAARDLTAAETAAAFSGLSAGAFQGKAPVANGFYTGVVDSNWNTSASSGGTITLVAKSQSNSQLTPTTPAFAAGTGSSTLATVTTGATVTGVANVTAVTGVAGIAYGADTIQDTATVNKLATVTLNGYAASTVQSEALTTLSLANSSGALSVTNGTQKTLSLTVDNVNSAVTTPTYETVNLHVVSKSGFALSAGAMKSLTVDGSAVADISASTQPNLAALATVVVKGTAGLNFGANAATTLTSVDSTGTTGAVTGSIDGTLATYTGGAGVDTVSLTNTAATTKAISLGAGDDSLTLVTGSAIPTVVLDGGAGTDTLTLSASDAASFSSSSAFATKFANFEKIGVQAVAANATATVDLSNLNNINYVVSGNTTAGTAGVTEVSTVTLPSLTSGQSVTVGGRTVTLTSGASATAAQVAAVLASGTGANGLTVTGTLTGFTGAVGTNTSTVVFTSTSANTNVTDIAVAAAGLAAPTTVAAPTITQGDGVGVQEASTWTFSGLTDGQSYTVDGLTVTASATLTGTQVASAFAGNTVAGATLSGTAAVPTGWTNPTFSTNGAQLILTNADAGFANVTDFTAQPTNNAAGTAPTTPTASTVQGSATVSAGSLTLTNMGANGTLELTAGGNGAIVTLKDATGTSDVFNIVTKLSTANTNYGTVAVAGVETINLSANDTDTSSSPGNGVNTATLTLTDAAAKTVTITGNAHVTLLLDSTDTALTSINGSAMTGKLTVATVAGSAAAVTVQGGAGADNLTANHSGDVLQGGAGNDTLVVGLNTSLVTLTGGAGSDTFDVRNATTNVNGYATISDLGSGDVIQFAAPVVSETFTSAKLSLGDTAVFQDYANQAINQSSQGAITWFQFAGNTYVVEHVQNTTSSFVNGTDLIVKIAGAVDLSTASFSADHQTLLIA